MSLTDLLWLALSSWALAAAAAAGLYAVVFAVWTVERILGHPEDSP